MVNINKMEKQKPRKMRLILHIMILMIILLPIAAGLGVSPGSQNLKFEPGRQETITLDLLNDQKKDFTAVISKQGELQDIISLPQNEIGFSSTDDKKIIRYTVNMPQSFEKPGIHVGEIKIYERMNEDENDQISLRPSVGVVSQLFIHVPYPGKYAEATIKTTNVKMGDDIIFYINVFNLGEEDISKAKATIDIFDPGGKLYNRITTEERAIPAKKSGELVVKMSSSGFIPGTYYVNATLQYDEKTSDLNSQFKVDDFMIKLLSVGVDNFNLGEIARVSIVLQNVGNRLIKDIYSRLVLEDRSGNIVGNVRSYNIDLESQETKETVAYWDTANINPGKYYGELSINYEEEVLEKEISTIVESERIKVDVVSPTAMVVGSSSEGAQPSSGFFELKTQLSIITIILIIIAIILGISKFRKRPKGKS